MESLPIRILDGLKPGEQTPLIDNWRDAGRVIHGSLDWLF